MSLISSIKEKAVTVVVGIVVTASVTFSGSQVASAFDGWKQQSEATDAQLHEVNAKLDDVVETVSENTQSLNRLRYEKEFKEIKTALDGLTSQSEILAEVDVWVGKKKASKIASVDTLCEQPSHDYLIQIMITEETASKACRRVGAI